MKKKILKGIMFLVLLPFIVLYFGVKDLIKFFKLNPDYKRCGLSNAKEKKYLYRGTSLLVGFFVMMMIGIFSDNQTNTEHTLATNSQTISTDNEQREITKIDEPKKEEKKSKFKDYTYDDEQRMTQMVNDIIEVPDGSKQTRFELFNSSGLKSAKVVYSLEDSNGLIHHYDNYIIIDENWQLYEHNYLEKFEISSSLEATIKINCEDIILSTLKAPSTAEFPGWLDDGWRYAINDNGTIITIQTWVDSQNSFGAMIRTNYMFELNLETMYMNCINAW